MATSKGGCPRGKAVISDGQRILAASQLGCNLTQVDCSRIGGMYHLSGPKPGIVGKGGTFPRALTDLERRLKQIAT